MFRHVHRRGPGHRAPGMAIGLLLAQIYQVGIDRIPPVTLAVIGAQVAIFLRLVKLPFGDIGDVCVSAANVWYRNDWKRIALASFYHGDEWHLYFNMASMLWKGINLERRFGAPYFVYMLGAFAVLTNALTVALCVLADTVFHDHSYLSQCAVGFSAVLFALKVIAAHLSPPTTHYLMGFLPVPSRIACWAELLLIHILVPNASFVGHLSGIIIGLMYIKGPLKHIMDIPLSPSPSYTYHHARSGYRSGGHTTGYNSDQQNGYRSGHREEPTYTYNPDNYRYYHYTGGAGEDEQMARAMAASMENVDGRPQPTAPPPHEGPPHSAPYPSYHGFGGMPTAPPPDYSDPPSYEEATRHSRLYPDLPSQDEDPNAEIRRRRLARFSR